ncbi:MAG: WS/DGAT domain-containing protein [Candidatus Nanopelagicales bacterium]
MSAAAMTSQDALWLSMDRPNNLMVIDTVMWFRETPDWDAVRQVVKDRLVENFPVFRSHPIVDGDSWAWEEDPEFDINQCLKIVELPDPGDLMVLRAFVASQRSVAFDKSGPLWTMHLINNVHFEDGTVGAAIMARFHHSIADGIRLVQAVISLCDIEDDLLPPVGRKLRNSTTPIAIATSTARHALKSVADVGSTTAATVLGAAGSVRDATGTALTGDPLGAAGGLVDDGRNLVSLGIKAMRFPERMMDVNLLVSSPDNRIANDVGTVGKLLLSGSSVKTVWSGTPSEVKDAGWAPVVDLVDVKAIGRATGTTVNDVMLSAVSGALTRYLRERGDDVVDEVIWMIPVSVQAVEPGIPKELGNHFALVALRMPIGIDDVTTRIKEMRHRMDRIKNSDEAILTFGIQRTISQAPRRIAVGLTNFFADKAVGVLTNVPGPRTPMSLAGTRVDGILGWAPCSGDQPMTVCIFSYNGRVTVGFGTDKALVPDVMRLTELFDEEFRSMYAEVLGRSLGSQ